MKFASAAIFIGMMWKFLLSWHLAFFASSSLFYRSNISFRSNGMIGEFIVKPHIFLPTAISRSTYSFGLPESLSFGRMMFFGVVYLLLACVLNLESITVEVSSGSTFPRLVYL